MEAKYEEEKVKALELAEEKSKRGHWTDATKRLKRSRWENDRRYIQPGIPLKENNHM